MAIRKGRRGHLQLQLQRAEQEHAEGFHATQLAFLILKISPARHRPSQTDLDTGSGRWRRHKTTWNCSLPLLTCIRAVLSIGVLFGPLTISPTTSPLNTPAAGGDALSYFAVRSWTAARPVVTADVGFTRCAATVH